MTGLATVRVGDGDAGGGGGGLPSPSKPNNLSVKGASRTRCEGCCVAAGAVGGETGAGIVALSTTGLLVAAADVPLAFPFRVAGEGGTYPVGGAEWLLCWVSSRDDDGARDNPANKSDIGASKI